MPNLPGWLNAWQLVVFLARGFQLCGLRLTTIFGCLEGENVPSHKVARWFNWRLSAAAAASSGLV
jgi:hypothetical protein